MKLYTPVEAARRLGKTRQTVLRWVEEHRMKSFATASDMPLFTEEEMLRIEGQLKRRKTPDTIEELPLEAKDESELVLT